MSPEASSMFLDALLDALPDSFRVDVCVLGCGPAGLAIAREFLQSRRTVCVVESGGFECRAQDQLLARGASVGLDAQLGGSRVRAFGGGGSIWGGGCMPIQDHHLRGRSWVPLSDWPLARTDLLPYQDRASKFFGLEGHKFDERGSKIGTAREPHPFAGVDVENHVFARGSLDLGALHREELARAANVTVLLHANAVSLAADDSNRVTSALVRSLSNRECRIVASQFVLASGAIENARLLLVSELPRKTGETGSVHVGHYFMDHPIVSIGELTGAKAAELCWRYDRSASRADGAAFPEISIKRQVEARERIMAGRVHPFLERDAVDRAWLQMRRLAKRVAIHGGRVTEAQRLKDYLSLSSSSSLVSAPSPENFTIHDAFEAALNLPRRVVKRLAGQPPGVFASGGRASLMGYFEQAPDRNNRVSLSMRRDSLGVPETELHWRLMPIDLESIRRGSVLMGESLAKACSAEFRQADWIANDREPPVRNAAHHMGTTRMSESPAEGVVDPQCKMHGMPNLHVAGSSVFPSGGGWAFPTFTIITLAIRLADRLRLSLEI